jgi:hypothetical protein
MIVSERRIYGFKIRDVWFADRPFEITGCDRVVFNWCQGLVDSPGFEIRRTPTNIIDLSTSLDDIWRQLDKSSTRYAIRRAERENIEIRLDSDYDEFFLMYRRFSNSKRIPQIVPGEVVRGFGRLFTAWRSNRLIVGHYYICERPIFRLRLSASFQSKAYDQTLLGNASKYLHWCAIKTAQKDGYAQFDFGGLTLNRNDRMYGVSKFKLSFGGAITNRYSYIKDYSRILKAYRFAHRFLDTISSQCGMRVRVWSPPN